MAGISPFRIEVYSAAMLPLTMPGPPVLVAEPVMPGQPRQGSRTLLCHMAAADNMVGAAGIAANR